MSWRPSASNSAIAAAQPPDLRSERRLDGHDDLGRTHCPGSDERTLEHPVRIAADDRPVLERARLTLGGIHDHRSRLDDGATVGHRPPLDSGGEPSPTAPSQPGVGDHADQVIGLGFRCDGQRLPTPSLEVGSEVGDRLSIEHSVNKSHGTGLHHVRVEAFGGRRGHRAFGRIALCVRLVETDVRIPHHQHR